MLSAFLSKKFNFLVCFITICNSKYLMCYDLFMKTLKDFENELSKCSKCGLCSQACPIYKLTLNDCTVSKGKFLMLLGVAKGDLKLSKNINKYLDMCLKCKKCNEFCPAGIDVCTILNYAKYEYMSKTIVSKFINFLQSRLIFSNIIKLFQFISKPFRPQKRPHYENAKNIIYFKGCVNQICPNADNYINKIFKDIPINIIEPDFDCCGLPFLSEGNMKRFIKSAKHNIKNFGTEYDFIVNDCASCEDTILNYPKYIDDFEINRGKVINWGNLIALNEIKFKFNNPVKVTFHKPCHIKNDAFFNQILKNCTNVEYIQMENYDDCCGLSGTFGIKNPKLSSELMKSKANNIIATGAQYVVTTCPSCIIGLKLALKNTDIKVVSLLEFLSSADEIGQNI